MIEKKIEGTNTMNPRVIIHADEIDLSVNFCGMHFPNPFILPSAQSVRTGEMILRAFEAGWGGAVTQTITVDSSAVKNVRPRLQSYRGGETIIGIMNIELVATRSLNEWLSDIKTIKQEYPKIPLIASIMGAGDRSDEWVLLAKECEAAGADALELNLSIPHGMTELGTGAVIGQSPQLTNRVTNWVVNSTDLPIIVKLTPNVTDVVSIAKAAVEAGAQGVTAINNLKALAGIDIEKQEPLPSVVGTSSYGGYAGPGLKPVGLRIVAEIAQSLNIPIAGTGGIESWEDAVEYILVGANIVQIYTAVMKHGYGLINDLTAGLRDYMKRHSITNLSNLTGLILPKIVSHSSLPREPEKIAVYSQQLCIQCGQCYVACEDSGFQAIKIGADDYPIIDLDACDGCGLCVILCPVDKCMWMDTTTL